MGELSHGDAYILKTVLDRADCDDFGCHNSIRLETKHFLNTLALTFISFSGRFVFAMQKHYLFFCERSSSCTFWSKYQKYTLFSGPLVLNILCYDFVNNVVKVRN